MSNGCAQSEPFALRVLGDSMLPEFEHGAIIIVEPDGVVQSGSYVVALHENEYLLRQLIVEDGRWWLKPLNDRYAIVEIVGIQSIKGLVVQRAGKYRRDRKRYI